MKLQTYLEKLTTEEEWDEALLIINHQYKVWKRLNLPGKEDFIIGQYVSFTPKAKRHNTKHIGQIVRINRSRAHVNVVIGGVKGVWNVPFSNMLPASKEDMTKLAVKKMNEK